MNVLNPEGWKATGFEEALNDAYAEGRKDEAEERTAMHAGWQLVPIEPTPQMLPLLTGYVSLDGMNERDRSVIETRFRARWAEILAAAAAEYTEGHEAALASAGRLEFIPRTECDDPERCRQFKFCRRHPHPSCGVVPA